MSDAYNKAVPSGNKAKYRQLLHIALVLGNSWCGSHCARLGSLQAVDDTALANIRQTWSEIFDIHNNMLGRKVYTLPKYFYLPFFLDNGTNSYEW